MRLRDNNNNNNKSLFAKNTSEKELNEVIPHLHSMHV